MATREFLARLRKTFIADGRLLEAGFLQLRIEHGLENADPERVAELRRAYLAGARHCHTVMTAAVETERMSHDDLVLRAIRLREEVGRFEIEVLRELAAPAEEQGGGDGQR